MTRNGPDLLCVLGHVRGRSVQLVLRRCPGSGHLRWPAPVYKLTIAARSCPDYPDISANRRRNNIMESLRDLGPDSPYPTGALVSPAVETPAHPDCRPLVGWQVQTGQNFNGLVDGLTIVTQPDPVSPPTLASTPELDGLGNPTERSLPGAVSVTLTAAQVARAAQGRYVLQGGTTTEPLLGGRIPGGGAFGVLRCSNDNNNADNVEYVQFPSGTRHVFCYAYYIDTAVPDGTIVVRKQGPAGRADTERFGFGGNVSYEPGGRFGLTIDGGLAGEIRFRRAATRPGDPLWEITEDQLPVGWTLDSLTCSAPGGSVATVAGATVRIDLASADTVTCTYVNLPPPVAGLVVRKLTEGGVGSFDFTVVGPSGPASETRQFTIETTTPGVAASSQELMGLTPGEYTITEVLPDGGEAGTWALTDAECDGVDLPRLGNGIGVTVTIPADGRADCHFDNRFTPRGRLGIRLVTHGGTGTAAFDVTTADPDVPVIPGEPDASAVLTATTSQPGVAVDATGDPLDRLDVDQTYVLAVQPPATTEAGSWRLRGITCTPAQLPGPADVVQVLLPPPDYAAVCEYAYDLVPPGTLQVVKHADGPAGTRASDAIIDIRCASTAAGLVVLDPDRPGPEALPEAIRAVDPTTCTLAETATGAAPGAGHSLRAVVARDGVVVEADWRDLPIDPGVATEVNLFNTYTAAPPPTTSAPPTTHPHGGRLPDTGRDLGRPVQWGLACIGVGVLLRVASRSRRRSY